MAGNPDGTALLGAMKSTYEPGELDGLSAAEHLAHVHEHHQAAGEHADLASEHVKSAGEHLAHLEPADGDGGHDGDGSDGDAGHDGRAMPASAQPQGSAQARSMAAVRGNTGAARAYRMATGRRG